MPANKRSKLELDPVLMQSVRLDYLSGLSLRDLAKKYQGKVSYRTINKQSIKEAWLDQRSVIQCNSKEASTVNTSNQALEVIQNKALETSRDLGLLMHNLQELAHRASDALATQNFDSLDVRDLGVMLKLLVDGVEKLQSIGLKGGGGSLPVVSVAISLADDDAPDAPGQDDGLRGKLVDVVAKYADSVDFDLLSALKELI